MTDGPARRELAGVLHGIHDAATTKRLMSAWQAEIIAEAAEAVLNTRGPLIHRDSTYAAYDAVRRVGDPNAPSIHDEASV